MPIKFVTDEAALMVGKALVIADIHLGIEKEYYDSGIKLPSQLEKTRGRIDRLIRQTKAERLVFLGDLKHKVPGTSWQENREIPEFVNYFDRKIETELVLGNHDADIKGLIPNIRLHSKGLLVDDAYLTHGHLWPDETFLKADYVVIGHTHPLVQIRDSLGYSWRMPVWIRAGLLKKRLVERYPKAKALPELVIMPGFNEFSGGINMNGDRLAENRFGPLVKSADLKKGEVYLLDGTFLGELKRL